VGAYFFLYGQKEGRTDMTILTVGVRNFANAPKTVTLF